MGGPSDAFRLIEIGGDPRQFPKHDYQLFLPLLLVRYSIETLPFLIRYPEAGKILEYLDLDYRLIQRQAKEEIQLQKQSIGSPLLRSGLFESGTAEDRARIVLVELTRLHDELDKPRQKQRSSFPSQVLNNPLYRSEVSLLISILTLRCRNPVLDIQAIVRDLRVLKDPEALITLLIANHPTEYYTTIESLLDSDQLGSSRTILSRLCKLAVHRAWDIRQQLLERRMFPNLAIELTIEHCHDEINFMNRILRGQPKWLIESDPVTKSSRTSILEFIFSSLNDELQSPMANNSTIHRLLRILSGMLGLMNLILSAEQLEISLQVLEMRPEPSTIDIKVCLILMCATQLFKYGKARIERVLTALLKCRDSPQVLLLTIYFQTQQLLLIDEFASNVLSMTVVIPREGFRHLETLFTTGFSDEQLASCALSLGQSRPDYTSPFMPAKSAFNSTSSNSLTLPNSSGSNTTSSDLRSSSYICVAHLLKRDIFHRSHMDVRDWILRHILDSTTLPLDVNMVPLLTAYAEAVSRSEYISRIPFNSILAYFENPAEDVTPPKVLLALYMLLNNEVCHSHLGNIDTRARSAEYPDSIFQHIQIRKILLYVQNHQGGTAFESFQPMFLKLVNAQFPELFDVTTLLMEEGASSQQATASGDTLGVTSGKAGLGSATEEETSFKDHHIKAIAQHLDNPDAAVKAYRIFQRLPQMRRQSMSRDIIQASLPSLLDPNSSSTALEAFKNTWDQLNSLMPHELWAMTINACRSNIESSALKSGRDNYSYEWLVQDPLLLFNVDLRVFRTPVVFRMFIQILGAVMVASRHYFRTLFEGHQIGHQSQDYGEIHLGTAISLQDITLIQMLLEICQSRTSRTKPAANVKSVATVSGALDAAISTAESSDMDVDKAVELYDEAEGDVIKEIRVVTFNFLHQQFIDNKNLAKLIHFQGYPLDLIPIMVKGVDSIHICIDFLPELLLRPPVNAPGMTGRGSGSGVKGGILSDEFELQVFALRFAAQLCERFPLPNTLQMATEVILPRLRALAIGTGFSSVVLESATVLAKAFPTLREDIVGILRETSGSHDKAALITTLKAIDKELADQSVWNKSIITPKYRLSRCRTDSHNGHHENHSKSPVIKVSLSAFAALRKFLHRGQVKSLNFPGDFAISGRPSFQGRQVKNVHHWHPPSQGTQMSVKPVTWQKLLAAANVCQVDALCTHYKVAIMEEARVSKINVDKWMHLILNSSL
ncbi:Integrator complex subunit 2 [Podila epicladia]|nr:Integrator complex subunit 2 [Podila epicladia]